MLTVLRTGYAFLAAYLKGEESKLLSAAHVDRIFRTTKVQDALVSVKDTDIGSYFEEVSPSALDSFDEIDDHLWAYFGKCIDFLRWLRVVPGGVRDLLSVYIRKYDVANVKVALRGMLTGEKARMIPVGAIASRGMLESLAAIDEVPDMVRILRDCGLNDYALILDDASDSIEEGGAKARLAAEAALDSLYYDNMLIATKKMSDGKRFVMLQGMVTDLVNLQMVYRAVIRGIGPEAAGYLVGDGYEVSRDMAKAMLELTPAEVSVRLENGKYGEMAAEIANSFDRTRSVTVVDEVIEKHKFTFIREMVSTKLLSPLLVAWYLALKELELRNLRLILKAISDGAALDKIKDYLVLPS
ncbi:V-type ATPase subunit [Chloroflexota bacterium]